MALPDEHRRAVEEMPGHKAMSREWRVGWEDRSGA